MENLKLIMSKAFFINANMCCVRRAGTELSADQLVLPIFKVTDRITPPSPPPPLQSCFLSHISARDMYKFFEHISFSPIVMRSWGTEHTARSLLIGGKSYWARIPDYASFSDAARVRLLKLVDSECLKKKSALKINYVTQI